MQIDNPSLVVTGEIKLYGFKAGAKHRSYMQEKHLNLQG